MLILEGCGLQRYVLGPSFDVPQHVTGDEGVTLDNSEFFFHKQQDKLLASWLLSTMCDEVLVHLMKAAVSSDIWLAVVRCFATRSNIKLFSPQAHALLTKERATLC